MTESTMETLHVLVIADPGAASKRISSLEDEFEEQLKQIFGVGVHLEVLTQTVRVQPDHQLEMSTIDSFVSDYDNVDAVIMLTGIPRHTSGKPLVAEVLADRKVAVISFPTLGAWTSQRRVLKVLASCINQLVPHGSPASTYRFMPRWGRWSEKTDSGH